MASDNGNGEKRLDYHGQTDRVFVRAIAGEYNLTQELARLRSLPRVIKGRQTPFHSGPQQFSKHYLEPKDGLGQTLHIHLEEYAPGGKSQKHGHVNEAVFYILVRHAGILVTTKHLLRCVWGAASESKLHDLHVYIRSLRKKLDNNAGQSIIQTEGSAGYRLLLPMDRQPAPSQPAMKACFSLERG